MKIVNLKLNETVCYLIPIENKCLLIETGCERYKNLFYKKLENLNISINDIAYVFLTHHHDDQSGLLNEIKAYNPSCRVIMHTKAIPNLQGGKGDLSKNKYINAKVGSIVKIVKMTSFHYYLIMEYALRGMLLQICCSFWTQDIEL